MESDPEIISRRLTLSQWILKFDKYLLSNPKLYEYIKEYFYECYKNCSNLRKELHNDFLPKLESELGFPSKKEFYNYENFFKTQNYAKFDLADFYYYNDDLNLFNRNNNNSKSVKNKNTFDNKNQSNKKESKNSLNKISTRNKNENFENENEESVKETISNNMETFGKQIEDTDEYSESKKNEESNKSLKEYKDINEKNETKKTYFSKRLPNFVKKVEERKKQKNY